MTPRPASVLLADPVIRAGVIDSTRHIIARARAMAHHAPDPRDRAHHAARVQVLTATLNAMQVAA